MAFGKFLGRGLGALLTLVLAPAALACTGISLRGADGAVIVARTVEWALGDAHHDTLAIFPRRHEFVGQTPEGHTGHRWQGKYGFVSLSAYGQPFGPDGVNEAGLYVGMYYFPDFASFAPYDKAQASRAMSVGDFMQWMLSSFSSVKQVRDHLSEVVVVNVEDPRFGGAPLPFHWKVADPSGDSIVIEITSKGHVEVFDAFLGVITNSPGYGWHLINLRNYLGLSPSPQTPVEIDGKRFAPLGSGSGLRGLPGDFTPPSRFVRAVALTASARPLATAHDAVFEAFRILDSFNIPVGATDATDRIAKDIESATQVTTVTDLKNTRIYFHTMSDRQVRMLDLKKINFDTVRHHLTAIGASREQTVRELTLKAP